MGIIIGIANVTLNSKVTHHKRIITVLDPHSDTTDLRLQRCLRFFNKTIRTQVLSWWINGQLQNDVKLLGIKDIANVMLTYIFDGDDLGFGHGLSSL